MIANYDDKGKMILLASISMKYIIISTYIDGPCYVSLKQHNTLISVTKQKAKRK